MGAWHTGKGQEVLIIILFCILNNQFLQVILMKVGEPLFYRQVITIIKLLSPAYSERNPGKHSGWYTIYLLFIRSYINSLSLSASVPFRKSGGLFCAGQVHPTPLCQAVLGGDLSSPCRQLLSPPRATFYIGQWLLHNNASFTEPLRRLNEIEYDMPGT